jgi:predicted Zn-dependent protease
LEAAEGWLGLGNWQEAKAELDCISPPMRERPVILCLRWNIHAAAKQWQLAADVARKLSQLVPELSLGWLKLAHALHALKRTKEARDILLPVVDRFPGQFYIRYKLAS